MSITKLEKSNSHLKKQPQHCEPLYLSSFFHPSIFTLSIKHTDCVTVLPFGNSKYTYTAFNKQTNYLNWNELPPLALNTLVQCRCHWSAIGKGNTWENNCWNKAVISVKHWERKKHLEPAKTSASDGPVSAECWKGYSEKGGSSFTNIYVIGVPTYCGIFNAEEALITILSCTQQQRLYLKGEHLLALGFSWDAHVVI